MLQAAEQSGHAVKAVIFLTIDESVLRERWRIAQDSGARGERADDAEEKLSVRLAEFQNKTLPVIEYYREQGLLLEIDASADIETVNQHILEALAGHAAGAYGASSFGL